MVLVAAQQKMIIYLYQAATSYYSLFLLGTLSMSFGKQMVVQRLKIFYLAYVVEIGNTAFGSR